MPRSRTASRPSRAASGSPRLDPAMRVSETSLPGVLLVEPKLHGDARGRFVETFHAPRYAEHGIADTFVQDNVSSSVRGVLRGLHFQHPGAQAKLAFVLEGEVFDVAVDIRLGSPSFGQWVGVHLTADRLEQLYIPAGFAHGFCVLSERAVFAYKCSDVYRPADDRSIRFDDPAIGIVWPLDEPSLSAKDRDAPRLADVPAALLPTY